MFLNLGDIYRIDDPTPEQIAFHLRHLTPEAPFIILDADSEHFVQAASEGDLLRVEWRQESSHGFIIVPVEDAERAFDAFRRWDESALNGFAWEKVTIFNDRYRLLVLLAMLSFVLAAVRLCSLML